MPRDGGLLSGASAAQGGTMEIYGDVYFLINAASDVIALGAAGLLLHRPTRRRRLLCGGLVGGLYAFLTLFLPAWLPPLLSLPVSALMVLTAYPAEGARAFVTSLLLFLFSCLLLGGTVGLCGALLDGLLPPFLLFFILVFLLLCGAFLLLLFSEMQRKRQPARGLSVVFSYGGKEYLLRGFPDSGNLLCDPLSGDPVIVLGCARALFPEPPADGRTVLLRTVSGGALLPLIVPEHLKIDGAERRGALALCEKPVLDGYDALVPTALL